MSTKRIYYEAQESIISEIAERKSLFSFRTIVKLLTASSIAKKL